LTAKKLSICVRPGVDEVRTKPLRLSRLLTRLLLPTLLRPAKAISGQAEAGQAATAGALVTKTGTLDDHDRQIPFPEATLSPDSQGMLAHAIIVPKGL